MRNTKTEIGDLESLIIRYNHKYQKRTDLSRLFEGMRIGLSSLGAYGIELLFNNPGALAVSHLKYYSIATFASLIYIGTKRIKYKSLFQENSKIKFEKNKDEIYETEKNGNIYQTIFKHPNITGTLFTLASFGKLLRRTWDNLKDCLTNNEFLDFFNYQNSVTLLGVMGLCTIAPEFIKNFESILKMTKNDVLFPSLISLYYKSSGNNKEEIKNRTIVCKNYDNVLSRIDLGRCYLSEQNLIQALENFSKVPNLIKKGRYCIGINDNDYFTSNFRTESLKYLQKAEKRLTKNFNNFSDHLEIAMYNLIFKDYQTVQDCVTLACNVDPEHEVEANVLGSLIYEHVPIEGLAERQWTKTIDLVLDDENLKYSIIAESNSEVYRLNPKEHKFLSNFFVFKANSDRSALEAEANKTKELEELVKDHEEFGTAKNLHLSENIDGRYFYVTRYSDGKTLSESDDIEDYKKAARYLGLIHKEMMSDKGLSRWMDKDIKKYLSKSLSLETREHISENLQVAYNSLKGDLVFDKDAHIFNWIKTKGGKIISVDNEDKGHINQFLDLVKIAEYSDVCNNDFNKRKEIIKDYFRSYGTTQLSESEIELSYLNATIIRTFAFYSFAKDKEIESQRNFHQDTQINAIINGIDAIDKIEQKYAQNYSKDDLNRYKNLQKILNSLI